MGCQVLQVSFQGPHLLHYAQEKHGGSGGMAGKPNFGMVGEIEVPGAVYSILPFKGMLLGSVNNRVMIWKCSRGKLDQVCVHSGHIIALHLQAMGDHILVGDLMRSASLLMYKAWVARTYLAL